MQLNVYEEYIFAIEMWLNSQLSTANFSLPRYFLIPRVAVAPKIRELVPNAKRNLRVWGYMFVNIRVGRLFFYFFYRYFISVQQTYGKLNQILV